MEKVIADYVSGLTLGEPQVYKNLAAIPLFHPVNGSPPYLTLKEALAQAVLTITELSHEGTVPELKVINKGDMAVLLLDGEELTGAKQNRVLNTTILLAGQTETVIPVSCTEHGRWSYRSSTFDDSGVVMASQVRRDKARSVSENLKTAGQYRSNQGEVWDGISTLSAKARVQSPTAAMKDVFESKAGDIDAYLKAVELQPGQKGIAILINGVVVGLDVLSRNAAYAMLHAKLVKSYAMEAMLEQKNGEHPVSADMARRFIDTAAASTDTRFKSVGLGWDVRFEAPNLIGSALEHDGAVIHLAAFNVGEADKVPDMAGYRRRRSYRRQ
jgi:hypothetical protein